ncbi:hypothetical protein QRX50_14945 [Amycolatopsis carbonis]|uniref:Uncharacterized protein n=1 Tax=Amycolatopsis carbonis TaxID=715471 RepID=A0A9Y2ILE5_9PSEU|nr:hypothetical protein [Amycolatopsis sp. 2-15]WIX81962.1 hypothetical protein QRX50_14945 [Amycolatopsis sp. 2-15]
MADGNPLVSQAKQDGDGPGPLTAGNGDYGYATGIGVAESAMDAFNGIKDGDWVSGGLGVLSLAGEIAGAAIDPFGYLMSSVASFLMEHVQPLKDMLDSVAGNPPVIQSYADTWGNVAKALQDRQADYTNAVKTGTAEWTGDAADAYRKGAAECAEALGGAATVASAIGTVTMIMGQVVSFVRETVRQLIADLVGKLISWVMEEVFSLGFGTPLVVAQAVTAISKWGEKISGLLTKLCDTMRRVSPLLGKLADVFTKIIKILGKLAGKVTGLDVISTKNIKAGGFAHHTGGGGSGGGSHHGGSDGDGDSPGGEGSDSPDGSDSSHSGDSDTDSAQSGDPDSGSSRSGDSDSASDADGSHSGDGDSASSSPDGGPSTRDGSSGDSSRRSTGNGTHDGGGGGDNSASTSGGDSPSHGGSAPHSTSGPSGGGSPSHAGSSSSSPSHAGSSSPSGGGSSAPSHTGDAPSTHTGDAPSSAHAGSSPSGGSAAHGSGGSGGSSGSAPHSTGGSGGGAPAHSGGGSSSSSSSSSHQSSGDSSTSASGYAPPEVDEPAPSAPAPRTGDGAGPSGATTPNQPVAGGLAPQGGGAPAGSPSGGVSGGTPAARPGSGGGWTGTPGSPGARTPEPSGPRTGPDRGPSSRRPGEGPEPSSRRPGESPEPSSRRPDSGSPRRPSDANTRSPQSPDGSRRPGDPAAGGPRRPSDAPEPVARGGSPTAAHAETDSPHRTPDAKPGDRSPHHGEPDDRAPHHHEPDDGAPHHDTDGSPDHHDNADHHDTSDHHNPPDHDGGPHHHDDEPLTPDEVNQHHSESTPAGSSYHRGDTDMGDLPHRVQPDPDGRYTVDVHVTSDGHARIGDRHYTPEEFADVLRHNADYDGRPIRLIGCDAGSNDFADRLSRELDTDVMAPTKPAWTDSNGRVFSSDYEIGPDGRMRPRIPPDGEWSVHHPDGTSHHAGQDGFAPESHHHDPHDVDADSAHARGDDANGGVPEEEFDLPPATRTYNPDSPEFDRRFVDWDRPADSEFAGPRHRDGHPDIDSPCDLDDVPARTSNADPDPDGVPQTLLGERPLAGHAEYHVSYENGASTRFYTDADGHITHVEATPGTASPNHNPDLRYPLIPGAQYRVPNFHDPAKSWTFHIGENGKPDAMTGDPSFDGRNDTYRDTNSQNRSGGEGKEAFTGHPEYGDKYEKVRWAGGHLAANEMGGPGEYVNMHPQMAASNSGNYRDGWIHEASWRNQETALGKFANTEGQDIQNYQVAMHGDTNGVPESVTMRWQEVVYKTDANGHVVLENGKSVEISRVTKEREFPNNPADINFGKNRQYSDRSRSR